MNRRTNTEPVTAGADATVCICTVYLAFVYMYCTPQNYRLQNGKQYNSYNSAQSALARRVRQGCTGSPPPHYSPTPGGCDAKFSLNFAKFKIILSKFRVSQNFEKII